MNGKLALGTIGLLGLTIGLSVGGWIANIVRLVGLDGDGQMGLLILRVVGIFVAPLGVILGFISN